MKRLCCRFAGRWCCRCAAPTQLRRTRRPVTVVRSVTKPSRPSSAGWKPQVSSFQNHRPVQWCVPGIISFSASPSDVHDMVSLEMVPLRGLAFDFAKAGGVYFLTPSIECGVLNTQIIPHFSILYHSYPITETLTFYTWLDQISIFKDCISLNFAFLLRCESLFFTTVEESGQPYWPSLNLFFYQTVPMAISHTNQRQEMIDIQATVAQ